MSGSSGVKNVCSDSNSFCPVAVGGLQGGLSMGAASASISVFPNPVAANQNCWVKISGMDNLDLENASFAVYNLQGQRIYFTNKVEELNELTLQGSSGIYIGHVITIKGEDFTFKIVMTK